MSHTTDFLVHSRAAPGAAEPDPGLTEAHWAYMDRFADGMIARGPTLAPDRETWTGSVHIVALDDADAAHRFAEHEPYNRAGLFDQHLICRFDNLLGRTMWELPTRSDDPRFMVIALAPATAPCRGSTGRPWHPSGSSCTANCPRPTTGGRSASQWHSKRPHDPLPTRSSGPTARERLTCRSTIGSSAAAADG